MIEGLLLIANAILFMWSGFLAWPDIHRGYAPALEYGILICLSLNFVYLLQTPRIKQAIGRTFPRWRDLRRSRRTYRAVFGHYPRFLFAKTFNEKFQRSNILHRDPRIPPLPHTSLFHDFSP